MNNLYSMHNPYRTLNVPQYTTFGIYSGAGYDIFQNVIEKEILNYYELFKLIPETLRKAIAGKIAIKTFDVNSLITYFNKNLSANLRLKSNIFINVGSKDLHSQYINFILHKYAQELAKTDPVKQDLNNVSYNVPAGFFFDKSLGGIVESPSKKSPISFNIYKQAGTKERPSDIRVVIHESPRTPGETYLSPNNFTFVLDPKRNVATFWTSAYLTIDSIKILVINFNILLNGNLKYAYKFDNEQDLIESIKKQSVKILTKEDIQALDTALVIIKKLETKPSIGLMLNKQLIEINYLFKMLKLNPNRIKTIDKSLPDQEKKKILRTWLTYFFNFILDLTEKIKDIDKQLAKLKKEQEEAMKEIPSLKINFDEYQGNKEVFKKGFLPFLPKILNEDIPLTRNLIDPKAIKTLSDLLLKTFESENNRYLIENIVQLMQLKINEAKKKSIYDECIEKLKSRAS